MNKLLFTKLLTTVLALLLILLAITGAVDKKGKEYADSAFTNALLTFGIARGINGVISVAQGTEIAIQPAGLGINFTPGQILDPINDLIEQFSWVMLASSASLGIQKVFLNIGSHWLATFFLTTLLIIILINLWKKFPIDKRWITFIHKSTIIVIFIRFAIPITAIGTEYLYQYFLSDQYQESTERLQNTQTTIDGLNKAHHGSSFSKDETVIDRAKKIFSSASDSLDIEARFEQYKTIASEASKYAINLIVVFVIQTIIFPLLFISIIYNLMKKISRQII
jgi:hypothetical protein